MSIFLNNNLGMKTNIENTNSESKPAVAGKLSNLPEYISALKEGSVFKGEILDVRNNAVKILLNSNDVLNAKTDGSVQMNIGDILNFRVESNTGLSMLVKAVSVGNINANNMLLNALQSAEIPVNERNLALVKELVDNGQPIDKNTIKTLVSNLNNYNELTVDNAVNMYKHNIPITKDNVIQFNNYIEQNNKLVNSFNQMTDNIIETVKEYVKSNPEAQGRELLNNILKAVTGNSIENITSTIVDEEYANISMQGNESLAIGEANNFESTNREIALNTEGSTVVENAVTKEGLLQNDIETAMNQPDTVRVKGEPMPDKLINNTNLTDITEFLENIKEDIKSEISKNLFIDKELLNLPEDELKAEVEKYYKEVEVKTDKLLNVLENAGLEKSPLHQNASSVKANLNFMNDMSNMALYMQIPVKFQENEAHGELYVLNRNRNKNTDKDVITAFLHLDMENLGATDVNIRLEKEQLTTKFTLEDPVSQDIVEAHLPELKKRLDEKGYNTTLLIEEISEIGEENRKSPFEQVLTLEEPKNFIKRYTLDVRA